jgi:two-component system NarL family response regulator
MFKVVKEFDKTDIRILVAEDHPVVADGILAVLGKAKDMVVVGHARNGEEAIELLKHHQPDIALLDLRMPLIDGIGVIKWIKCTGSSAKPIVLTMFEGEDAVTQAIHAGASAFLLKDTPSNEILKMIRHVHQRKTAISRRHRTWEVPCANLGDLKPLELEILALLVEGYDNRKIGSMLRLSTDGVKYLLRGIFSKLGVRKRAAAARQAIENGIVKIG